MMLWVLGREKKKERIETQDNINLCVISKNDINLYELTLLRLWVLCRKGGKERTKTMNNMKIY